MFPSLGKFKMCGLPNPRISPVMFSSGSWNFTVAKVEKQCSRHIPVCFQASAEKVLVALDRIGVEVVRPSLCSLISVFDTFNRGTILSQFCGSEADHSFTVIAFFFFRAGSNHCWWKVIAPKSCFMGHCRILFSLFLFNFYMKPLGEVICWFRVQHTDDT